MVPTNTPVLRLTMPRKKPEPRSRSEAASTISVSADSDANGSGSRDKKSLRDLPIAVEVADCVDVVGHQ